MEPLSQALKRRGFSLASLKSNAAGSYSTADALTAAQQGLNDARAAALAHAADAERALKREHAKSVEIASLQRSLTEASQRAELGARFYQRAADADALEAQVLFLLTMITSDCLSTILAEEK